MKDINKILAKAHFKCNFFLNDAKKQHFSWNMSLWSCWKSPCHAFSLPVFCKCGEPWRATPADIGRELHPLRLVWWALICPALCFTTPQIISTWYQTIFKLQVITYKHFNKISSKWPQSSYLDFQKIYCMHQPSLCTT